MLDLAPRLRAGRGASTGSLSEASRLRAGRGASARLHVFGPGRPAPSPAVASLGVIAAQVSGLLDSAVMTYIVTETCVDLKDKSCIEVCPVDCIHETDDDRMVYIDPDECIDCGACVDPCPVDAIFAEEDVPTSQIAYIEINKGYFKDRAAARARLDEIRPRTPA